MPENVPFRCRICGCERYKELYTGEFVEEVITTPDGAVEDVKEASDLIGYACEGCSVMFEDPAKFGPTAPPNP